MEIIDHEYIKSKRIERGLSLLEVAKALGFKNASTYMKYENGEYSIKAEMLPVLSNILQCEIENFFKI